MKRWHCKHIALGLKALWMPTSQTVPRPSCSCSSPTGTYSAQKPHHTFPLCAPLSALDLLSWDSRFCPIFIGVFFMFYFIFWCPLYEKHPLKMIMLELSEMLVQHGAARGGMGLSNSRTAGMWQRRKNKPSFFPRARKMFGNRAISWITRLSMTSFQPLELIFPSQESEVLSWIGKVISLNLLLMLLSKRWRLEVSRQCPQTVPRLVGPPKSSLGRETGMLTSVSVQAPSLLSQFWIIHHILTSKPVQF